MGGTAFGRSGAAAAAAVAVVADAVAGVEVVSCSSECVPGPESARLPAGTVGLACGMAPAPLPRRRR